MSILLERSAPFYRPLYYYNAPGKGKPIEKIIIFNSDQKFIIDRGWLENNRKDIEKMEFEKLPVKRNIDYTLTNSFLSYDLDHKFTLFLYIKDIKESVYLESAAIYDLFNYYYKKLEFVFNGEQITENIFDHSEDLPERAAAVKLADELNALLSSKLTEYDTVKILKYYKIEKK